MEVLEMQTWSHSRRQGQLYCGPCALATVAWNVGIWKEEAEVPDGLRSKQNKPYMLLASMTSCSRG